MLAQPELKSVHLEAVVESAALADDLITTYSFLCNPSRLLEWMTHQQVLRLCYRADNWSSHQFLHARGCFEESQKNKAARALQEEHADKKL